MGLAGPRIKQRLGLDPQNKAWADDKSKFGLKMMEKMGWSEGKGLGAREDGIQENIKVRLKDNNLGIGATKKSINNWLGNTDAFSQLLADLNQRVEEDQQSSGSNGDDAQKKDDSSSESEAEKPIKAKKDKKTSSKEKKKSKKEKKDKKDKKSKKSKKEDQSDSDSDSDSASGIDKKVIAAAIAGRKASRHKYLKNKHAAIQNAERLNEILGIRSETASPTTSGVSTPTLDAAADGLAKSEMSTTTTTTTTTVSTMKVRHAEDDYGRDDNEDTVSSRPAFNGLGFVTSSSLGGIGYSGGSGLRGLGFVKATVSAMNSTIVEEDKSVTETMTTTTTTAASAEVASAPTKDSKDKKDKKDKKEKKDKKDKKEKKEKSKKRKADSDDGEKSKKKKSNK